MAVLAVNTGDIVAASVAGNGEDVTNIQRANISAGTPTSIVVNNGAGLLTDITRLDTVRGGTGINSSGLTGVAHITAGVWSVDTVVDAELSPGISRGKLAATAPNNVLVNDGAGLVSEIPRVTPKLGGTGIDTSTSSGVAKVTGGAWSVGRILDVDVDTSAAIARSKLATGAASEVVINAGDGKFASEPHLAVSRGGTGADFSGAGSGPFVLELSSGVFSNIVASSTATAGAYVKRDGSANASFNGVGTMSVTSTTALALNAVGNVNVNATGSVVFGNSNVVSVPTGISGGLVTRYVRNRTTGDGTYVAILTIPTVSGPGNGTAYFVDVETVCGDNTGGTDMGAVSWVTRARNNGGVLTGFGDTGKRRLREGGLGDINGRSTVSGTDLVIEVRGVVGLSINWTLYATVSSQEY